MTRTPRKADRRWKLLEHTADLRIEVCGDDTRELFLNAAQALTELLGRPRDMAPETNLEVTLDSPGPEELLVDWLRELFFYNDTRGMVLDRAEFLEFSDTSLRARLFMGRRTEEPEVDIKGVTYHGISVEKSDQGYCARVVFDI
jgi:SHS2 domain-containing protein